MPNQPTIIVTVTEEPPAYHGVDGDKVRIFAVHLTFDGGNNQVNYLLKLQKWEFRAYKWAGSKATLVGQVECKTIASASGSRVAADRLMYWLDAVADFQQQGTSVGGDVELPSTAGAGNPSARDVLGGSIAWDAPIPQDLGLTYLVKCKRTEVAWPDRLLILPLEQPGQPANTHLEGVETSESVVTISSLPFGGFPGVNICTGVLSAPPVSLPTPLADAGGGFLASSFDPDDFRVIEAIEAKGASLISALPVFLGFLSATIRDGKTDITPAEAVAIGCRLAFDPLLLALGTDDSPREAFLLSGLAGMIDSQLSALALPLNPEKKASVIKERINQLRSRAKILVEAIQDTASLQALGVPDAIRRTLFPSAASQLDLASVRDGLNALLAHLQSESGSEAALSAIIASIKIKEAPPSSERDDSETAVVAAEQKYLSALDAGINAANAIRAEVGRWVLEQVLSKRKPEDTIEAALENWSFYTLRINGLPASCVAGLKNVPAACISYFHRAWAPAVAAILPVSHESARRFQPDSVPQPLPISISPVPGAENLGDFTSRFNGVGVIIRSASPTAQGANGFGPWAHANLAAFDVWQPNGGDKQPHYETLSPPDRIGIRAFLPVAVDGRQEMFLRYHGFPLSSDAYRDTIRDEGNQSGLAAKRLPFYAARDVNPDGFQKVPRLVYGRSYQWAAFAVTKGGSLPKILQSANAPWIPMGDLGDCDLGDFKDPKKGIIGELKYPRRTAVGATTIVDQERQPSRIGVGYPEVFPLALDAPRLCLSAIRTRNHGCQPFLDMFRNADGSGQLGIEVGDMWTVDCRRLLVTNPEGKPVKLVVEWCRWDKNDVAVICMASADVSTQSGKDLSLEAQSTDPPAGPCDAWLRLRLETEATSASLAFDPPTVTVKRENAPAPTAGAAGDPVENTRESSESEANKRPAAGDPLPCHADTPPVLLVGADACWAGGFTKSAFAEIILPRVTWLDWEHWCGNQSLAMYGCGRSGGDVFSKADGHLLTASVLRSLDDEINRLLDRLPDPSVSALIVELTVIDKLLEQPGGSPVPASQVRMSVVIDCSKISGEAFGEFNGLNTNASSYRSDLRNCLIHMDKRCRIGVEVKAVLIQSLSHPTITWSGNKIVIEVPEGTVARLTIRPFVEWPKNGHPAFHEGIRQLAVGEAKVKDEEGCVFEGATLTIEAMHDPFNKEKEKLKDLATQHESVLQRHIDIVPIANARDYRVFFGPHLLNAEASSVSGTPPTDPWRLFSHVEMRTQRWRFSGRPIYGWIDPNKFAKHRGKNGGSRAAECAAVEQQTNDAVKRFEAELFFDRDDADCEFTRVRLTGGRDELLACPWELPSATYFRHAFNFVSRYAGAMRPGSGVPLLPRRQADWSHRVAMLADAPRLEVTRPQARCIVPLTTSPDDDGPAAASPDIEQRRLAPTPPVACILEERPFAVGGLAERMLGEIVTGVGYGFEGKTTDGGAADGNASRVQPLDFAKETSRDGRLSAWAWTPPALPAKDNEQPPKNPSRSFVVETEGPVGLHFEEVTTPAPAWSNCQYLLRPRSLDNGVPLPEESFLGVQLRRFLDPDWIFEPGPSDGRGQDSSGKTSMPWPVQDPCIVRYKLDKVSEPSRSLVSVALGDPRRSSPLVTWERKGATLVISARVNFLGAGYREESRVLCELPVPSSGPESPVPSSRRSGELALLHMPHGDGSFTMSIAFLPDDAAATEGRSTAPLIAGTFRWTLNHLVSGGSSAGTGTAGRSSSGAPAATSTPAEGSSSPADQGSANKSAMLELPVIDGQSPVVRRTAMSQPTYREWTRTAKNADFVTAMTDSGIDEPVRIADLAATINGDCALAFQRRAGIAPSPHAALQNLWLCGSLENSRMPLPVHRYLVGVFTKNASRGGRKYPSFSQARLLVGRNPSLPRQLQLAEADSLTIHEMEVPAKIVVGGNLQQGPLDRFNKAVIDLRATGGRPSDAESGTVMAYRLHVRFANSPAAMEETTAEVHVKTSQGTMKIKVSKTVQSLDVMWTSVTLPRFLVQFITGIGTKNGEKPNIDRDNKLVSEDSVEVTIPTCASSCGELWADVSLLHRAVPDKWVLDDESFDHVTFDWLFSAAAAQDDRFPDRRTLVKTLTERFEAQGRFVSSSPPIPITNVQH